MSKRCCQVFFHLFFFPLAIFIYFFLSSMGHHRRRHFPPRPHHTSLPTCFSQGTSELYLGCSIAYTYAVMTFRPYRGCASLHAEHSTAPPWSRAMRSGGLRLSPALCSLLLCPHSSGQSLAEHISCGVQSPSMAWESWRCLGRITARTEASGREPT